MSTTVKKSYRVVLVIFADVSGDRVVYLYDKEQRATLELQSGKC